MPTIVRWGLLLAATNAGLLLLGHALGYQGERVGAGAWLYLPVYLGMFVITGLAVRAARQRMPAGEVTFGRGLRTGVQAAAVGGLVAGAYAFFHFRFFSVGYADHLVAHLRTQPAFQALGAEEIAGVERVLRAVYSPVGLALATPAVHALVGTLGALLVAAVWCRPRRSRAA